MTSCTRVKLLVAGGRDFANYRLLSEKLSQITANIAIHDLTLLCSNEAGVATLARLWSSGAAESVSVYRCDPLGRSFEWADTMVDDATHAVVFDGGNDPVVAYIVERIAKRGIPSRNISYQPETDLVSVPLNTAEEVRE